MSQQTPELQSDPAAGTSDIAVRRTRLREFQSRLVERMQTARSGEHAQTSRLGLMIGKGRWLVDLQTAGEIVPVGAITKVPLTQPWFLGLTNIRGNLISVIDFAHFIGQPPSPIDKDCRIVAFSPALSINSGLLVSRVLGLRNTAEMHVEADTEPGAAPWAGRRYVDRESHVWTELDLSSVVHAPQFQQVGA